jgi:hypothetical protein
MSESPEVMFDLQSRVRALERREFDRQMQDIVRRIEALELASRSARSERNATSGSE